VVLGGGLPFFPALAERIPLRPTTGREFANGARLLEYEVVRSGT
jgi:hypothetical protein